MTKKWIYVARPLPQQIDSIVQKQAHDICEQVASLLKDDERREKLDTLICWVFYPEGEVTTKINEDVKPLQADRRMEIYETVFLERMMEIDWPHT